MGLRGIIVCLATASALAVGAGFLAIRNIDVNTYRSLIAAQVEAATGRDVTIAGQVDLQPSLYPTIVIEQASLSNADWGTRPRIATVERLELQAALLPLLAGRVEIRRVLLSGAEFFLETDAAGRRNWDFRNGGNAPATTARSTDLSEPASSLPTIGNVVLENTVVTIRNSISGRTDAVLVRNLSARSDGGGEIVNLTLDGTLNGQAVLVEGAIGALSRLFGEGSYPLDLTGQVAGAQIAVEGELTHSANGSGLSLNVAANGQSLADLGRLAAIDLPPLGPYSLAAMVDGSGGVYKLSDTVLQLGGSDLSGALLLQPRQARWQVDGVLYATRLDFGDFALPATGGGRGKRIFSDEPLPLTLLRNVEGTIKFSAEHIVDHSLAMNSVSFDLALAGGRLDIMGFQAGLAGGSMSGTASLETGAHGPRWSLQLEAGQMAAGDLLRMLSGNAVLSGGRADLAFDLRSRGNSLHALMTALSGTANAQVSGGVINDDFIKVALTDLFRAVSFTATADGAQLNCAVGRFAIEDGIARTRRLVTDTRGAALVGRGQIDLRRETINLHFEPTAKGTSLAMLAAPFDVTGSLADPSVRVDPASLATRPAIAALGATGSVVGSIAAVAGVDAGAALPTNRAPAIACNGTDTESALPQDAAASTSRKNAGGNGIEDVLSGIGDGIESLFDGSTPANNKAGSRRGSKDSR